MNARAARRAWAWFVLAASIAPQAAFAGERCSLEWLPGDGVPGVNGVAAAMTTWDPDGPGPAGPRLVVAGNFTLAGNTLARGVAAYDPASGEWSAFGPGLPMQTSPPECALAALPNGDLIVAGIFTTSNGAPADYVARWSPVTQEWYALGLGVDAPVYALLALPDGDLIASGVFTHAGGALANRIARWHAATNEWTPLGGGVDASVSSLATLPDGKVVVGGGFSHANGIPARCVATWDPASGEWEGIGAQFNLGVETLTVRPNGDIVAGGPFHTAGGAPGNGVALWSAASQAWSPLGSGVTGGSFFLVMVNASALLPSGDLVVTGSFSTAGGAPCSRIARWSFSTQQWYPLGQGLGSFSYAYSPLGYALCTLPDDTLIVGGAFSLAGNKPMQSVARWNLTTEQWSALAFGTNGEIRACAPSASGDVFAGGLFSTIAGAAAADVARLNPTTGQWTSLGTGIGGNIHGVLAMLPHSSGDLLIGGNFTTAGDQPAQSIARWNESTSSWTALTSGVNGNANAFLELPDATVLVGGGYSMAGGAPASNIARWNLSTSEWSALGTGVAGTGNFIGVRAFATLPSGDVVVGGRFMTAGGAPASSIARWNPTTGQWSPLGAGVSNTTQQEGVNALLVLPNGSVLVGGRFESAGGMPAGGLALWNPATEAWSTLGTGVNGSVYALKMMSWGDVLVGGAFSSVNGAAFSSLALWRPSTGQWFAVDGGVQGTVLAAIECPSGDLYIGGWFAGAGGHTSAYWARAIGGGPCACIGDVDCSGAVDFFDIDPFVAKIGCPGAGAECDASCPWQNADVDQDGDVDFFDIDPFVSRIGASCP